MVVIQLSKQYLESFLCMYSSVCIYPLHIRRLVYICLVLDLLVKEKIFASFAIQEKI